IMKLDVMKNKKITTLILSTLVLTLVGCVQFKQPPLCDAEITPIATIQGSEAQSPWLDQQVTTRGIVTAVWQGADQLQGFFIRSIEKDDDLNPATSEGLFIHVGDTPQLVT